MIVYGDPLQCNPDSYELEGETEGSSAGLEVPFLKKILIMDQKQREGSAQTYGREPKLEESKEEQTRLNKIIRRSKQRNAENSSTAENNRTTLPSFHTISTTTLLHLFTLPCHLHLHHLSTVPR